MSNGVKGIIQSLRENKHLNLFHLKEEELVAIIEFLEREKLSFEVLCIMSTKDVKEETLLRLFSVVKKCTELTSISVNIAQIHKFKEPFAELISCSKKLGYFSFSPNKIANEETVELLCEKLVDCPLKKIFLSDFLMTPNNSKVSIFWLVSIDWIISLISATPSIM